ncbi:iron-sulfur cluster assembly scaffold protein [Planctomycetota bacterium]
MVWQYSDKTTQLFMDAVHGKPGTHLGEFEEPDGIGEHGSIACGDAMRFSFRVEKDAEDPQKDIITEARYLTFGCTSAIAASEALCMILEEGRYSPLDALKITNNDIVKYLGGLPRQKLHCSVMGAEALEAAVFNWSQKRGVDLTELGIELPTHEEQEGRVVCTCFTMTEPYLKRKIKELQLKTIADITDAIKAGGACTSCHHAPGGLQDLLDEVWGRDKRQESKEASAVEQQKTADDTKETLSPYQFAKAVEKVIDEYIRPMLRRDGGDLEIVDIKEQLVYTRLLNACAGCPGAAMTLKMMVEQTLKDQVDQRIKVIPV